MKLLIITTLFIIAPSFIFSQTKSANGTEPDLKLLVQQQIDEVKANETKEEIRKEEKADPMQTALIDESDVDEKEFYFKMFLLVDACFAAALVVLWRRRRNKNSSNDGAEEDKNAALQSKEILEAERKANELKAQLEKGELDVKKAGELKKIRKNLQSEAASLNLNGETVGKKAKELSISKGEIYLAARIKSQEMANECLEN